MAVDSEFCNGRLRLSAFLRAVETEGPKPPTRFKRVACVAFQQQKHLIEGSMHRNRDTRVTSGTEKTHPRGDVCPEYLDNQRTREDASHPAGVVAAADGDLDPQALAQLPVPLDLRPADEDSELFQVTSSSIPLMQVEPKAFADNSTSTCPKAEEVAVVCENGCSKFFGAFQKSQKGDLPLGELSLARKPTNEDSVNLSRESENHTTPIADIDPIEDGQSRADMELNAPFLDVTSNQLTDAMGRRSQLCGKRRTRGGPPANSPVKLPLKVWQGKAVHGVKSPFRPGVRFEADGFVGDELKTTTLNEAKFQRKAVSRKPGRKLGLHRLELAHKSPHVQTPQPTSFSGPVRAANEINSMSSIRLPRKTAKLAQLDLMPKANQIGIHSGRMQQNDVIICNQLSSATARTQLDSRESTRSTEGSQGEESEDESFGRSSTSESI